MKSFVLWDLDGTLTDPRDGIIRCFQYALEKAGHPVPKVEELLWTIGPPLQKSFARQVPGASEAEVWDLIAKYRERFAEVGWVENKVYDGVPELLRSLRSKRHFVATSKPHVFAKKIIEHFGLSLHFEKVHGAELDGVRSDKGDLITYILEQEKIPHHDVIMIGDREHDILGAKKARIPSIGITWGYGSHEEHKRAGADWIVDSPADLQKLLQK